MFSKLAAFFKGFFHNVAADPASSVKGVVQLGAAAAVGYGMATGIVPIPVGAPMAASFATSGIHALGTNSATGVEAPAALKTEAAIETVTGLVPNVLSVVDQVSAIKAEADAGQKKIDIYQAVATALAQIVPPPAPVAQVAAPIAGS
jgi:hypothetical protein